MVTLLQRRKAIPIYPRQFWFLFWGSFFTRASLSMLWPFVTIIIRERLEIPLATATLLLSIQAVASLLATLIISPVMDRFGRKQPVIWSLIGSIIVLVMMAVADTLPAWIILMAAYGALSPVFWIGVTTMVADIIEPERRSPAYALLRMITNAGIAIGPIIGGMLATVSFELIYYTIAVSYLILTILSIIYIQETRPETVTTDSLSELPARRGYAYILKDKIFLSVFGAYMLVMLGYTQIFVLLPIYAKENFGLVENQYSLLLTVNATMVVLLQYAVTKFFDRFSTLPVMTFGAFCYAVGLGSVVWAYNLPTFVVNIVIITLGELILLPTTMTFIANIAPTDMRARYMGILGLGYPVAAGIGPVIGGYLNDHIAPSAIWVGAGFMSLLGVMGYAIMSFYRGRSKQKGMPV